MSPSCQELADRLRRRVARDPILRRLRDSAIAVDAEAWVVGGYPRDIALERAALDADLVVGRGVRRYIARLETILDARAFRFRKRGVTTWRMAVGERGIDLVDASRRGLGADLFRRDFTINAIAYDLRRDRVDDPTDGLRDLGARRLRLPRTGVLREDPLRALRAARFLAQFPDFDLHRGVPKEAAGCGPGLRRVSAERIRYELERLLIAEAPARGLRWLEQVKLLDAMLPELAPLRRCIAGDRRPNVWQHTPSCLDVAACRRGLPGREATRAARDLAVVRWSILLHDISKPETMARRADGRPTFHGHETLGADRAGALLQRLRASRSQRRRVCGLIRLHLRPSLLAEVGPTPRGLRRLIRAAGPDLQLLAFHAACDALGSGSPDARRRWHKLRRLLIELIELAQRLGHAPLPRLVGGRDVLRLIGGRPGPAVGRLLEAVQEAQEAGRLRTRKQALAYLSRHGARIRASVDEAD